MIGFALVGCGRIAPKHAETIANRIKSAKLIAVCDIDTNKSEAFGKKYSVPFFADYNEMLTKVGNKIDVINILTPSGYHAKHTIELVKYGKHIVVEKPMALTLDDADGMIKACDAAGVKLFVVKQNRYNLPVKKLREAIDEGRFGKLVLGTVRVRWSRDQRYYDQDAWRGTWKLDGGVLANQASHHIDLLEWMLGEVDSVSAKSATQLVDIETEDTAIAILKFRNGALGIIEATTACRPRDLEGSISILGEKGSVVIGGFAVNELQTWDFCDSVSEGGVLSEFSCNPDSVYGFGHVEYLADVVESIKSGKRALVDGLEGRKSLELITAIYESIETGKDVSLRFTPNKCRLGL